jgi:hypothetical protein
VDGNTQIKLGDEVVVCSKVTIYNGVYETLSEKDGYKGYVYSLNGATSETAKPVIVIKSFTETETGVSAEWTAPAETKSFTVKLYKESVAEANLVKSETATENKIDMTVTLEPATKYILSVSAAVGETTIEDSAELTTSAPAAANEIDFTKKSWTTLEADKVVWENDFVTVTLVTGTSSSKANNYIGGSTNSGNDCKHTRFYKGQEVTIAPKAGKNVTSMVLASTENSYAGFYKSDCTFTNATIAVDGVNVTITPTDKTKAVTIAVGKATRIAKLTVNAE